MNRKIWGAALIGTWILAVFLLAGCAKKPVPQAEKKTVISLWYYWDNTRNQRNLEALAAEFNASQNHTEVKIQYVTDEDFKKRVALGIADGEFPELILMDSSDFVYYHSMQPFVDLTEEIPELSSYLPVAVKSCTIGDRIYGLPFGMDCAALFYNKEMLKSAGCEVPVNWEEFYQAAVKITRGKRDGFGMTALQSEETMFQFLPILWSMGGDVSSLNSPESNQAFELIETLTKKGAIGKQSININLGDLTDQFISERIAMMFGPPMAVDTIRADNPDLDFGVARVPSFKEPVTIVGGEVFGVTRGENQDAAIAFLKYLADKERMAAYMDDYGYLAPRQDVLDGQFKEDPLKREFITLFQDARTREFTKEWPSVSLVVCDSVRAVIMGERPREVILWEAEEAIRRIRKEGS